MEETEKIFFKPGDVVTLKQKLPNKPIMLVVRKETNFFKDTTPISGTNLKGIRCRWFTTDGTEQQSIFSTKDLVLLQKAEE